MFSPRLVSCPVCAETTKLMDNYSPLEWIEREATKHRFIVLIFYRGVFREFLKYVRSMNDVLDTIRRMGGEMFAVTSKQLVQQNKTIRLSIVNDYDETIAKKYGIEVMSLRRSSIDALKDFAFNLKHGNLHIDTTMPQPGILVLHGDKPIFRYSGDENDRLVSKYKLKRIAAHDVANITRFCKLTLLNFSNGFLVFQHETAQESIRLFINTHKAELFDTFLNRPVLKQEFTKHLLLELRHDELLFLEDVQNKFVKLISAGKNVQNELEYLYKTYIMDDGERQISLPRETLKSIREHFIISEDNITIDPIRTEQCFISSNEHIFYQACVLVKRSLGQEVFQRFLMSEMFQREAAYAIASCYIE
jgi:hypothetical protein